MKASNILNSNENFNENYKESDKLKKINSQLLEQIKNLKLEIQRLSDSMNNSRVIELTNEVNLLKRRGEGHESGEQATK